MATPSTSTPPESSPRPGPSARPTTTLWPNRSAGSTRPSSSSPASPGRASRTSRSPPPNGSTGSTKDARSSTATTSRPSRPSRLTTLTNRPQRPLESQARKSPDTPGRFTSEQVSGKAGQAPVRLHRVESLSVSTLVHTASRDGPPTSVTDTITSKIKNPSYTTPRDAARRPRCGAVGEVRGLARG